MEVFCLFGLTRQSFSQVFPAANGHVIITLMAMSPHGDYGSGATELIPILDGDDALFFLEDLF